MAQFYPLQIKNIVKETNKSVSISFIVPNQLKELFVFKAGQYITLKAVIDGVEIRRDYSLCSSPNRSELEVAIKEVKEGTFSSYANKVLKVGDTLEVAPPKGRFVFEPNDSKVKNIVAFAAGSGITPVLSIIKCALEEENHSKVILVYGNKTVQDTMFWNELLELRNQYTTRFFIQFVFSQADEDDALFGRIDRSAVNYVLKNKYKDILVDTFYICGPEEMTQKVKDALIEQGVTDEKIHFELFKETKQPDDVGKNVSSGKTKVIVMLDDEESTFEMSPEQSVLEAALDANLDAPYSCRGGICSTCMARLKEGEVKMRQNNILTDSEVAEGFILTCQSHPLTPTIYVDYDDI